MRDLKWKMWFVEAIWLTAHFISSNRLNIEKKYWIVGQIDRESSVLFQ